MVNIAVFASGSGTNFEAIVRYFVDHEFVKVRILLCNHPGAGVIDRAARANIESCVFTRKELAQTDKVLQVLKTNSIHFIVLAGFLLRIPERILEAFPDRIVNIHPALLPKYGGKGMYGNRVHEAVLSSGDTISGITIHMVNEEYDKGNIVAQYTCEIHPDDTPDTLGGRIHKLEHYWFPRIIEKLLEPGL